MKIHSMIFFPLFLGCFLIANVLFSCSEEATKNEVVLEKSSEKLPEKLSESTHNLENNPETKMEPKQEMEKEKIAEKEMAVSKEEPFQEPFVEKDASVAEKTHEIESTLPKEEMKCTVDQDCGSTTCHKTGIVCYQDNPVCKKGVCSNSITQTQGGICDANKGECSSGKITPILNCKSHCDCSQGKECKRGKIGLLKSCVSVTVPVYCCSNAGCPTGEVCTDAQGNGAVCQ